MKNKQGKGSDRRETQSLFEQLCIFFVYAVWVVRNQTFTA